MQKDKGKIVAVFCVLIAVLLLLSGCGQGKTLKVGMFDLNEAMLASSDRFCEMKYASGSDSDPKKLLKSVSDIDPSKVDDFFISYASNGSRNADEIVVLQLKSKSDVSEAKASLKRHVEYRKSIYEVYDPTQSAKISSYSIVSFENIVCLIVADDVKTVENAFYGFLR